MKYLTWIVTLTVFFLILSEGFNFVNLIAGIAVAIMVIWLNHDEMNPKSRFSLKEASLWGVFILTLFREVIISNLQVARIVLRKNMNVSPRVVEFESRLRDDFLLTVLANAITLTPGTMTVDIKSHKMKIHCLNADYADGLEDSSIEKLLLRIEEMRDE